MPDDIVLLEAGDRVPADGRLAASSSVELDESARTGEYVPAGKLHIGALAEVPRWLNGSTWATYGLRDLKSVVMQFGAGQENSESDSIQLRRRRQLKPVRCRPCFGRRPESRRASFYASPLRSVGNRVCQRLREGQAAILSE